MSIVMVCFYGGGFCSALPTRSQPTVPTSEPSNDHYETDIYVVGSHPWQYIHNYAATQLSRSISVLKSLVGDRIEP